MNFSLSFRERSLTVSHPGSGFSTVAGGDFFRLHLDTGEHHELEAVSSAQVPSAVEELRGGYRITYREILAEDGSSYPIALTVTVRESEEGVLSYCARIQNNGEGVRVNELQLPILEAERLAGPTEQTDYPYNGNVSFTFDPEIPHDLTVKLRIPCYASHAVPILLNGEEIAAGEPGSYVTVFRRFERGDVLSLEIPFALRMHPYSGEHDVEGYTRAAYTYGPLLLALRGERNHPCGTVTVGTPEEFPSRIRPTERPLVFTVEGMEGYTVEPYFGFEDGSFVCFPLFRS